jgi:hypothetical protein
MNHLQVWQYFNSDSDFSVIDYIPVQETISQQWIQESIYSRLEYWNRWVALCMDRKTIFQRVYAPAILKFLIESSKLCEFSAGSLWSFINCTDRTSHLNQPWFQGRQLKHQLLCCYLRSHCRVEDIHCYGWHFCSTPSLAQRIKSVNLPFKQERSSGSVRDNKLKKGELIAQHPGTVSIFK